MVVTCHFDAAKLEELLQFMLREAQHGDAQHAPRVRVRVAVLRVLAATTTLLADPVPQTTLLLTRSYHL